MKYRTIAIDCDDVIVETGGLIIDNYNRTYGTNLDLTDLYGNDNERWGVKDEATAIARLNKYLLTDEYCNAPPLQEAVDAIGRLARRYELHVVTGRMTMLEAATQQLLDTHFPKLFSSVTFTNLYGKNPQSKADVCRKLDAQLLVDDHLGHALPVAKTGVDVLLFGDYPWNQSLELPPNVRRTKNWSQVLDILT